MRFEGMFGPRDVYDRDETCEEIGDFVCIIYFLHIVHILTLIGVLPQLG